MSSTGVYWRSISVKYESASLDFKRGNDPIKFKSRDELACAVESLLIHSGGSKLISEIIRAMIKQKIVRCFFDHYTSPLLGPKTQRLNFVFPLYVVVPFDHQVQSIREIISAVGKKSVIGGRAVSSKFELDVVIEEIKAENIPDLLKEHKEWFIGELEIDVRSPDDGGPDQISK